MTTKPQASKRKRTLTKYQKVIMHMLESSKTRVMIVEKGLGKVK